MSHLLSGTDTPVFAYDNDLFFLALKLVNLSHSPLFLSFSLCLLLSVSLLSRSLSPLSQGVYAVVVYRTEVSE